MFYLTVPDEKAGIPVFNFFFPTSRSLIFMNTVKKPLKYSVRETSKSENMLKRHLFVSFFVCFLNLMLSKATPEHKSFPADIAVNLDTSSIT